MSTPSDPKLPLLISVAMVAIGLIIAAIGGISSGSITGGIIAALAVIPACWGMVNGMQQKTQGPLAMAIGVFLLALGVAALLIILGIIDWIR
jgi:hypothetical protein